MTAESCREWRGDLAAAAGDRLEPAEHTRLLAHLDGCPACRADLRDLQRSAALLALADPAHVGDDDNPLPATLGAAVLSRVQMEQSRARRTRRRLRAGVGTALVAAAAAIALVIALSGGPNVTHTNVALRTNGARADAVLVRDTGGTEVRFRGRGLHGRATYWLWLTGPDGQRWSAGTFNGGTDGTFDVQTYCALPYPQVRRVWVTDYANHVVLDARLTVRA